MNQRNIGLFLASALVVAACSSGGASTDATEDDVPAEDPAPTQEQTTTAESPPTTAVQADSGSSELGAFRSIVVIGSDQYDFALAGTALNCMTVLNRSVGASGALIDADGNEVVGDGGRAATLRLFVYADGVGSGDAPASIIVRDNENDTIWAAGPEFEGSEIGSVTIEDDVTRGTATFIEENVRAAGGLLGTPRSVEGTFELTC